MRDDKLPSRIFGIGDIVRHLPTGRTGRVFGHEDGRHGKVPVNGWLYHLNIDGERVTCQERDMVLNG